MQAFRLSDTPLDPEALKRELCGDASGGYVSFEGWVRNHNDGRNVLRLEYEAYPALALAEGARIIEEARARFDLHAAACVHRVGRLEIGDAAVWVGATAAHRGEAFSACRYIIDEIKRRVPIWKNEHYADGPSGWVNCEAPPEVQPTPQAFYARQVILPEVGPAGQNALSSARVLVVGAGGLGCAALPYLAAAGIGHLGICDADRVDLSNLHRQVLFNVADVGHPKAKLAADRLRAQNPFIEVTCHPHRCTADNARDLLAGYDIVLDCTDNFETKFLLNDACVALGKTLVQASIYQFEGQLFVVRPGAESPCLRCLWEAAPAPHCVGACADVGVLGSVAGTLGALQAHETLKQLLRLPGALHAELVLVDLFTLGTRRLRIPRRADCPACAVGASHAMPQAPRENDIDDASVGESALEVEIDELPELLAEGWQLIDMRDPAEAAARPLPWPVFPVVLVNGALETAQLSVEGRYVLVCPRGMRSRYLALHLRRQGIASVRSLAGGTAALT